MSHLIALTFDNKLEAQRARHQFAEMEKRHLVELEDSAVVFKDKKGKVKIDQTFDLTAAGAASGGFWGLLIGFLLSLPLGGPLLPFITGVFGVGFGALSGHLSDYGINDEMMKELGKDLDDGRAALFVLVRRQTVDKVLDSLKELSGRARILQTSFPKKLDDQFREVLESSAIESTPMIH